LTLNDASGWTRGWCDDDDIDVVDDDDEDDIDDTMCFVATVRGCRREDDYGKKTRTNDDGYGYG